MSRDDDCLATIIEASKQQLSRDEAEDIMEAVQARQALLQARGAGETEALNQAVEQVVQQKQLAAAQAKYANLLNLQKRVSRRNSTIEVANLLQKDHGQNLPDAMYKALKRQLVSINEDVPGARDSLEARMHVLGDALVGQPLRLLEKEGLTNRAYAENPDSQRAIAKELYELSKREDGKPGISKDPYAQKIAKILHDAQALAMKSSNAEGAFIGHYADYIAHSTYDGEKIRVGGFDQFKQDMMEALDETETFTGRDSPDAFLKNIYDNFVSGMHLQADSMTGFRTPEFSGPGNIAKRLSQSKLLHYKDADAWFDIQQKYGTFNTVTQNVLSSLQKSARNISLMERFGTNPRVEFMNDIKYMAEHFQSIDPGAVKDFSGGGLNFNAPAGKLNALMKRFNRLDGSADQPVNKLAANIAAGFQSLEMIEKGGSIALAHLTVPVTQAAEGRFHGVGPFSTMFNFMKTAVGSFSPEFRKDMADMMMVHSDGMNGSLLQNYSFGTAPERGGDFTQRVMGNIRHGEVSGLLSTLASQLMKIQGVRFLVNGAGRTGFERMLSVNFAKGLKGLHSELDPNFQGMLRAANIGEPEFNLLKTNKELVKDRNGIEHLTPDMALKVEDKPIEAYLRAKGEISEKATENAIAAKVERFRNELAMRVAVYFSESSRIGTNIPGVNTKAILMGNSRPGTAGGIARGFAAQFKQWPVELMTAAFARDLQRSPTKMFAAGGIATLAAGLTMGGYVRMAARNMTSLTGPPDPTKPETWLDAAQEGGALMLMGDMLVGQVKRNHNEAQAVASLAGGPVGGGVVYPMFHILYDSLQGKDVTKELKKFGLSHTPLMGGAFTNLWWAKIGINYLWLWHVYDMIDPGWAQKDEARKAAAGTPYLSNTIRPTQAAGQ